MLHISHEFPADPHRCIPTTIGKQAYLGQKLPDGKAAEERERQHPRPKISLLCTLPPAQQDHSGEDAGIWQPEAQKLHVCSHKSLTFPELFQSLEPKLAKCMWPRSSEVAEYPQNSAAWSSF